MQELAETTAIQAFQNQQSSPGGNVYCQIAETIRKAFDKQYQSGWNCIVGRSFGAFVTHKIKTYIYFQVPRLYNQPFSVITQPSGVN